jgi:nicotinamide phosphoribosyltransferase
MFKPNPLGLTDGYKVGHKPMLAPGTDYLYGTWIPRSLKHSPEGISKILSAGEQLTWRWLHDQFQEYFFNEPIEVAQKFGRDMSKYLGLPYNATHFEELHKLGYLPIRVKALPEGIETNPNVPHQTFINTVPGFAWLTLYLETPVSNLSWKTPTNATIGLQYRRNATKWVMKTDSDNAWFIDYACHDFAARGLDPFTTISSGLAHAFSFIGSDTLIVIDAARYFYGVNEEEVCIASVNASEHSVTCTGLFYYLEKLKAGEMNEAINEYYSYDIPATKSTRENPDLMAIAEWLNLKRWLEIFPTGILSVVSDTFDLFRVITEILPRLKDQIMARDGKLVIRPDSGDPVDITCGSAKIIDWTKEESAPESLDQLKDWARDHLEEIVSENTPHGEHGDSKIFDFFKFDGKVYKIEVEFEWNRYDKQYYFIDESRVTKCEEVNLNAAEKGVIELLWDIFGGTISKEGFKVLDSHIGAIYGDSINLDRQVRIYERLADKEFAATNIVLGVGSFTYQFNTRDTMGFAAKGAWFQAEGKNYNIYKDPATDDGTKKSLKGFVQVFNNRPECQGDQLLFDGLDNLEVNIECTTEEETGGLLQVIYENGKFYNTVTLEQIRERVKILSNPITELV